MVLKSYRLKFKKNKSRMKMRRRTPTGDIITGGITALVGIGLLAATSEAVSRV